MDNAINLFGGYGKKLLNTPKAFEMLNFAQWQPYPRGTFRKPNIQAMQREAEAEEAKKPKRTF